MLRGKNIQQKIIDFECLRFNFYGCIYLVKISEYLLGIRYYFRDQVYREYRYLNFCFDGVYFLVGIDWQ